MMAAKWWADGKGFKVGDTLQVTTPAGKRIDYELAGLYENDLGTLGQILVTNATMTKDWNQPDDAFILVGGQGDADKLEAAATTQLADFPVAKAQTLAEFKDTQADQVNQLLGLVYALLSLSVIVALLGIVNTLALAVHERTRELGLLRAVGMSKRQVRRMVRAESVITALIGAVLGLALGIVFALVVSRPLADEGFALTFPIGTLIVLVGARGDRGRAGGDPARAPRVEGRRAAGGDDGVALSGVDERRSRGQVASTAARRRPQTAVGGHDRRRRPACAIRRRSNGSRWSGRKRRNGEPVARVERPGSALRETASARCGQANGTILLRQWERCSGEGRRHRTTTRRCTSRDVAEPRPGPHDLLIDVAAAGVNRADLAQREGRHDPAAARPRAALVAGMDAAGVVAQRGRRGRGLPGRRPGHGPARRRLRPERALLDARLAILVPGSVEPRRGRGGGVRPPDGVRRARSTPPGWSAARPS